MPDNIRAVEPTPTNDEWKWPDPPTEPRDILAGHCRNWGKSLAYNFADTLLLELAARGFSVVKDHPLLQMGEDLR